MKNVNAPKMIRPIAKNTILIKMQMLYTVKIIISLAK